MMEISGSRQMKLLGVKDITHGLALSDAVRLPGRITNGFMDALIRQYGILVLYPAEGRLREAIKLSVLSQRDVMCVGHTDSIDFTIALMKRVCGTGVDCFSLNREQLYFLTKLSQRIVEDSFSSVSDSVPSVINLTLVERVAKKIGVPYQVLSSRIVQSDYADKVNQHAFLCWQLGNVLARLSREFPPKVPSMRYHKIEDIVTWVKNFIKIEKANCMHMAGGIIAVAKKLYNIKDRQNRLRKQLSHLGHLLVIHDRAVSCFIIGSPEVQELMPGLATVLAVIAANIHALSSDVLSPDVKSLLCLREEHQLSCHSSSGEVKFNEVASLALDIYLRDRNTIVGSPQSALTVSRVFGFIVSLGGIPHPKGIGAYAQFIVDPPVKISEIAEFLVRMLPSFKLAFQLRKVTYSGRIQEQLCNAIAVQCGEPAHITGILDVIQSFDNMSFHLVNLVTYGMINANSELVGMSAAQAVVCGGVRIKNKEETLLQPLYFPESRAILHTHLLLPCLLDEGRHAKIARQFGQACAFKKWWTKSMKRPDNVVVTAGKVKEFLLQFAGPAIFNGLFDVGCVINFERFGKLFGPYLTFSVDERSVNLGELIALNVQGKTVKRNAIISQKIASSIIKALFTVDEFALIGCTQSHADSSAAVSGDNAPAKRRRVEEEALPPSPR